MSAWFPVAVIVWAVVGVLAVLMLKYTVFGRSIYGIGNKEAAAYLSGIPTQRVVTIDLRPRRCAVGPRRRHARGL